MNIHELAAQAIQNENWYKKYHVPLECLAQAVDRMTSDAVDDNTILEILAPIYLALGPKSRSTKKYPTGLARYAHFAASGETRYYLNFIHVTPSVIVASDGSTLLSGPNDENLEPGYYCPKHLVKLHDSSFATYPDYTNALNAKVLATIIPNNPDQVKAKIEDKKNIELVIYRNVIFNNAYIKRVEHAMHGLPETADIIDGGMLIKKDDLIAVVMARRCE